MSKTPAPLFENVDEERATINGIIHELERRRRNGDPQAPPKWWRSIEIARRFEIRPGSSDDSRKRGVREVMDKVAERCHELGGLIASYQGYALARDAEDLQRYRDFRRKMGLAHLQDAAATTRSPAHDDATGQLRLK